MILTYYAIVGSLLGVSFLLIMFSLLMLLVPPFSFFAALLILEHLNPVSHGTNPIIVDYSTVPFLFGV